MHLLSGHSPAEIPLDGLRLNFTPFVQISSDLKDWLSRLLEPDPAQRYASAKEALQALHNPSSGSSIKPIGSQVKRPWWVSTGVGCLILFAGGVYYAWPSAHAPVLSQATAPVL